jgi:hypothetical protein
MLCKDLLEALKKFFLMDSSFDDKKKIYFINQLKEKLNKIINIISKLIVPIGALENTYKYIKVKKNFSLINFIKNYQLKF